MQPLSAAGPYGFREIGSISLTHQQLSQVALPHLGNPSQPLSPAPVETSRGVRPIHAAKSRPRSKLSIAGAKACTAIAPTSPTPGIVISRRNSSSSRTIERICLSTSSWPRRRASTVPRQVRGGNGFRAGNFVSVITYRVDPGGDGGDQYGTRAPA